MAKNPNDANAHAEGSEAAETAGREDTSVDERAFSTDETLSPLQLAESLAGGAVSPVRYRALHSHAKGGLGEVFLAKDLEVNRTVALKEIKARFAADEEARARFLVEAEITGRLEHPGIVPVYGLGCYADGRPYYAMRFIRGDTLKDAIDQFHEQPKSGAKRSGERSLELRRLLRRFVDVCNAIEYAHSRGVLHRDIKPANVMLGKYGETLVVDWGLAKSMSQQPEKPLAEESVVLPSGNDDSARTQAGSVIGTPSYMSPEQAAGELDHIGPASDVYSLGATLYQLLAGQPPVKGRDLNSVLDDIKRGHFPRPRQVNRHIPRALEAICGKAMSLDSAERYASPQAMAEDVERWLGDERVSAYREPLVARTRRWAKRHPAVVSSSVVAVVLLAVASVIAVMQHQRTTQRTREAVSADQRIAVAELQAGRFDSAASILENAAARLQSQGMLPELQDELTTQRDQVRRLIQFYKFSDDAWTFAGNSRDIEAAAKCRAALEEVHAWEGDRWWEQLPVDGLSGQQQQALRRECHCLLLLSASLLAKDALFDFFGAEGRAKAEKALVYLARAEEFQPSNFVQLIQNFCYVRTGQDDKIESLEDVVPETPDEYFFFGFIYFYYAGAPESQASEIFVSIVRQKLGLDLTDSLKKSQDYFKSAADLGPDSPWHHLMVAMASTMAGDFHGADMAVNACVALRPDLQWPYLVRGSALLTLGAAVGDPVAIQRGEQAYRRAEQLDPYSPTLYSMRATSRAAHFRWSEAFDDWLRYLELERPVVRGEMDLESLKTRFIERIDADDKNVQAHVAYAYVLLKQNQTKKALATAEQAIELEPGNHLALALRGTLRMQGDEYQTALEDFERALAGSPHNFLAAIGKAKAVEAAGKREQALDEFRRALDVAVTDWQRAESWAGRSRVLKRLGRDQESRDAFGQAQRLDPAIIQK